MNYKIKVCTPTGNSEFELKTKLDMANIINYYTSVYNNVRFYIRRV